MDTKNLAKEFWKWANFEWTGFGCDVCGYGTIEETDFDPYKPCPDGGTRSCGFKRGALVYHPKYGFTYVGGTMGGKVSLHSLTDGKRLCQNANPKDIKIKTYNTQRTRLLPALKGEVSAAKIR